MSIDVKNILSAWITSFNPSEDERKLAESRYEICSSCEHKGMILKTEKCNKCGCPISKKIFSVPGIGTCPLNKWDEIDLEFIQAKKKKQNLF